MAAIQYLPCLLSLSSSDPMGMENLRLLHGSLWKIPNWNFLEKRDITSELPHAAIMAFLFMWMDIFTRYWKNAEAQIQCNKGSPLSRQLMGLWKIGLKLDKCSTRNSGQSKLSFQKKEDQETTDCCHFSFLPVSLKNRLEVSNDYLKLQMTTKRLRKPRALADWMDEWVCKVFFFFFFSSSRVGIWRKQWRTSN